MSSTDERIVKMQFDNATFKQRAAETKQSLKDLDQAVETTGKGKGLFNLSGNMQKVMVTASKMSTVVTTALATITNKAVNAGLRMASSLTLDPLKQGFAEYQALLNKQQVIMNATGKSAGAVKKVLNDLNHYSDKTIFSFSDMTEGLTSFVNAGVPLPQASKAMKGIANASALAGASTQEAQSSFRAFGQALGQGFLGLQDFRQAAITGKIGTVGFKQTLIDAAVQMGTLTKKGKEYVTQNGKTLTATKGFDLSLQTQWASAKVLNKALGMYGDQTTALGKKAFKSAQDVRTFSAFMDTLKESIGSGWSAIFTTIFGGLNASTKMWTGISNAVGHVVQTFFNFLNVTLKTFKTLGGFQEIGQGFKNLWAPIGAIFTAVGDAWHKAFPDKGPGSGQVLFNIAHGFASITAPLQIVADWIPKLVPFLTALFKTVKMGASGLHGLAELIGNVAQALGKLFEIHAPSSGGFTSFFDKLLNGLGNMFDAGVNIAKEILDGIVQGFSNGSFDTVANIVGAGLLGGIFIVLRKMLKGGLFKFDLGGGLVDSIKETFGGLTDTLKAMQTQLKVKTLMEIAAAVGILSASVIGLSFIDGDKLKKSLTAVGVGIGELLLAMVLLDKVGGSGAFIKLPILASGLVLLSTAVLILTGAIAAMSALSWDQIGRGLGGVGAALVVIAAGMKLMPTNLPITGAGLVLVSVGLNAIAGAIALMGLLSWGSIGKGLATTAGALVAIAAGMQLMPVTLPITAAGLVLVSVALNAIAGALKIMGTSSWEEIGKGLTTLGGAMAILAAGLNLMGGTLLGSVALGVAAGAIAILTPSLVIFSKLSWQGIAKGMVALAGGLLILGVALTAMSASVVGAAALLIVAPAILALSTALVALSTLSWDSLATALVALAAGLTVIGVAGALLAPVVPALLGLGAALLLLGGGLALAGVGILAFSTGLAVLVGLGAGAIAYLSKFVGAFFKLLAPLGVAFGEFLASLAKTIGQEAPVIAAAFIAMLAALIDQARKLLPKLGPLIKDALTLMLNVIKAYIPKLVDTGGDLIVALIRGLGKQANRIVDAATDVIIKFAQGLEKNAIKMANAGIALIATFLHDLASAIRSGSGAIGSGLTDVIDAMKDVGVNMVKGLIGGITDMFGDAMSAIGGLAESMVNKAKGIFHISSPSKVFYAIGKFVVQGMTNGIQNNAAAAISATASMVSGQIAVANEYVSRFIQGLDQQALTARAKADGLAAAADKAAKAAKMTKGKKDDKAAERLQKQADAASKAADAAEAKAEAEKAKQDRAEEFKKASTIDKAKMRSEDAQNQLDAAKAAEARAAAEVAQANALNKQAKAKGVSPAERKRLEKQADDLRKQAAADAKHANDLLAAAKASAADALKYQKLAGDEAAAAFQAAFDADAKAAADEAAFNKLSDADKAAYRRKQAEDLQAKAAKDLNDAKALAYTDLEAANALAQQAMDEADQARQYLDDATQLESNAAQGQGALTGGGGTLGTVVNLDPTDAAAIAMNDYSNLYDMATAAAARDATVQFNQYNTSPEALSPTEVYRQTNNLLTNAVDKLSEATAA